VALCQARISTKPLWGFSSSNPYHSQSRAEQYIKRENFPPFAVDSIVAFEASHWNRKI
jgi:hypothetical protein